MDSQHRHQLEENALANWLADKVEAIKPQLPALLLGVIVLAAALIGFNAWKSSSASAQADRWRDFAAALEQGSPDLIELKSAADKNPGTPAADWADVTWADGKLYQASQTFFVNRSEADKAVEEAIAVYERLAKSRERDIAERASFQLGRALELQGKIDDAVKQYGRVTGAFAAVAQNRVEQLQTDAVKQSYEWITASKTGAAPAATGGVGGLLDSLEPDNIPLPEMTAEEADSTLDALLQDTQSEEEAAQSEEAAPSEEGAPSEEAADTAADASANAEMPPADETPAEETPAEESPAEGETADEAPAAEEPADKPAAE